MAIYVVEKDYLVITFIYESVISFYSFYWFVVMYRSLWLNVWQIKKKLILKILKYELYL